MEHDPSSARQRPGSGTLESFELRAPNSVAATGLPVALIEDIVLRAIISMGRPTTIDVAHRVNAAPPVIDAVVTTLRDRRLIEYEGMDGRSYLVTATDAGRALSQQRSSELRYIGPLPVPLDLYARVVRSQAPDLYLNQDQLGEAFSDLVIAPELIDQLGPAICGDGAIFLYGPPGTGKSSIAERLIRAYGDLVLIPHCLEVQGQLITIFDPVIHDPVDQQPAELDPRWVLCHRPAVIAGGELHIGMLDLTLDKEVGTYLAPLQLKANNGIFVIDDFGRQAMTPEQLLNRWIVPLDRQVDYLTLAGRKFQVPFEVKVVLSTNLSPEALGDEAFFRRIHNKVYVGCLNDSEFDWVLARVGTAKHIEITEEAAARLRQSARQQGDGELRAYLPGVVCKLATAICRYENMATRLTPDLVDRVLALYFAKPVGQVPATGGRRATDRFPAGMPRAAFAAAASVPTMQPAAAPQPGPVVDQPPAAAPQAAPQAAPEATAPTAAPAPAAEPSAPGSETPERIERHHERSPLDDAAGEFRGLEEFTPLPAFTGVEDLSNFDTLPGAYQPEGH